MAQQIPEDWRKLIGERAQETALIIDNLLLQLDLTGAEEAFAREQAGNIFKLLSDAYVDAYPTLRRARCATAASVIAFKAVQAWAEHDEAADRGSKSP